MTQRWKLFGPAIALTMATLVGTASAAVDPGPYNPGNVAAANPFGTVPVDQSVTSLEGVNALLGQLTAAQVAEVNQRCAVITSTRDYDLATIAFCDRIFVVQNIDAYENPYAPEVVEDESSDDESSEEESSSSDSSE